jgi:hypothetical protein
MNSVLLARRGASAARRSAIKEIGHTGTPISAGIIGEEYLAALRTPALRNTVWKKMRADAQIAALLAVTTLPLEASTYTVIPNEDDPDRARAIAIAERIDTNLRTMDITWRSFLYQAYLNIAYGFSLFEMIYEKDTGGDSRLLRWRSFAPRSQSTIVRWNVDEHGGLLDVDQELYIDRAPIKVTIPGERCLLFTHRQEGSNFEGRPILRDAYQHHWFKALLYRVQGIGAERMGTGFPLIKIPRDLYAQELAVAEDLIRGIRVNQEGGAVLPMDYEFEMQHGRGFMYDKAIEHHNRMIALTGLAQFLTLGSNERGSYALSESQGAFFLLALRGLLERFTDTMEQTAFRHYVTMNWGPEVPVPTLSAEMIIIDPLQMSELLSNLVAGGLLKPTKDVRDQVRDSLGMHPEELAEDLADYPTASTTTPLPDSATDVEEDVAAREMPVATPIALG